MLATIIISTLLAGGTPVENKENVRKLYEEVINRGKWELLPAIIAGEYEGGKGPAAYRATVEGLKTAFSELKFVVEELVAEGETVVVRWTWSGKHTAAFRQYPASGAAVKNSGIAIYRFRDGKVISSVLEADRLGVLQQIGAVPAPKVGKP